VSKEQEDEQEEQKQLGNKLEMPFKR